MKNKKNLIIMGSIIALGLAISVYYFTSTRLVSIKSTNVQKISIQEAGSKKQKGYSGTKSSVRIKKGTDYVLTYYGSEGYATGTINISQSTSSVKINPDYSAQKLSKMLDSELAAINKTILDFYPTIPELYTLDRGSLSNYGKWYFTTLTYTGSFDDQSNDTLVIGLEKQNNNWKIELTPNIFFSQYDYPSVSRDFINAGNQYHSEHVIPKE